MTPHSKSIIVTKLVFWFKMAGDLEIIWYNRKILLKHMQQKYIIICLCDL